MSYKASDIIRAGFLTVDGTLDSNNSQLYFRPLQYPLQPTTGEFYSLSPNQTTDPSLRINQFSSNGTLLQTGYLYDSVINPPPPVTGQSKLYVIGGGAGSGVADVSSAIIYSTDGITWYPSNANLRTVSSQIYTVVWNGTLWLAGGKVSGVNTAIIYYSSNGIDWTRVVSYNTLMGLGGIVYTIASSGPLWLAGGEGNYKITYSYNGINWYGVQGVPTITSVKALAYNGTVWVAGGTGTNRLLYSYDGLAWNASVTGNTVFTTGCYALAWNGTVWSAGGEGINTMALSYDGINWVGKGSPLSTQCLAVAWSGALWTAGGRDTSANSFIYSTDASGWSIGTRDSSASFICNTIAWTGDAWIAGGLGTPAFYTSADGIQWTTLSSASSLLPIGSAVAYNDPLPNAPPPFVGKSPTNPLILIGGDTLSGTRSLISSSTDGITWYPVPSARTTFPSATSCYALKWNGSYWLAGFIGGSAMGYSYDGLTWNINTSGSSYFTGGCFALESNGSLWLAGGGVANTLIYSYDGLTWAPTTNLFTTCFTIKWSGSLWVVGGYGANRLASSPDGSNNWTVSTSGNALFPNRCYSVSYNGAIWVAVGDTIAYSVDGQTWIRGATVPTPSPTSYYLTVAWNGTLWVAGGDDYLVYSYDGSNWIISITGTTVSQSVTWTGTLWISTGTSTRYSYNGITWTTAYNTTSLIRGRSVSANRPLPFAGPAIPPPAFRSTSSTSGYAVYSTGLTNQYVSNTLFISDLSHNIGINVVPQATLDISGSTRLRGDLSANTIVATGPIASSLALASRGAYDLSVNLVTGGNTTANWTYRWPVTNQYSSFLVNVNAVFDASNANVSTELLDISVNGVAKWFLAGTTPLSATRQLYPLSYTFVTQPLANAITVQGTASSGVFVNTNSAGNYLTTIDIVGIA